MEGYIKLWRSVYSHPLHPHNRKRDWTGFEAMIDLTICAHGGDEPLKRWKGKETIEIVRGQLDITIRQLAKKWRWSVRKVHVFLKHLEDEKFLSQNVNRWFTVITIEKYDIYNPRSKQKVNGSETEVKRKCNTIEREVMISNENINASKSETANPENEKMTPMDFEEFWKTYPIKKEKKKSMEKFLNLPRCSFVLILAAVAAQKKEKENLLAQGKFCPEWKHPTTWLNGECWTDEVEQQPEPKQNNLTAEEEFQLLTNPANANA